MAELTMMSLNYSVMNVGNIETLTDCLHHGRRHDVQVEDRDETEEGRGGKAVI